MKKLMKKIGYMIVSLSFLLLISFVFAQDAQETTSQIKTSPIEIIFPEHGVTYGPWSDTYFDYPRTGGKAHHIRINLSVGEDVAYYRIMRNNEWVQYVENLSLQDAVPTDSIVDFKPDDLQPLDLIGYLSAMQNLTIIAYDSNNNELGRDTAVFYIAVNLDDYYELIASSGEMASSFVIRPDDLDRVSVTEEETKIFSDFFTLKKYMTFISVKNKFTGDVENHTRMRFSFEPNTAYSSGKDVFFYTVIPKEIVSHINNMTLTGNYSVVAADPIMMWHFASVQGEESLEYDINIPINTEIAEEIVPIAVSDVEHEKSSWYFLIPLVIPVILLFAIIFFSRFKKKNK